MLWPIRVIENERPYLSKEPIYYKSIVASCVPRRACYFISTSTVWDNINQPDTQSLMRLPSTIQRNISRLGLTSFLSIIYWLYLWSEYGIKSKNVHNWIGCKFKLTSSWYVDIFIYGNFNLVHRHIITFIMTCCYKDVSIKDHPWMQDGCFKGPIGVKRSKRCHTGPKGDHREPE